jgi:solute carrier family 9 (sodium/hydrogen exchanger), member 8
MTNYKTLLSFYVFTALVIGSGVYLLGIADVAYQLNFIESFAFGSLISGKIVLKLV